jgi:hypothetical protein
MIRVPQLQRSAGTPASFDARNKTKKQGFLKK